MARLSNYVILWAFFIATIVATISAAEEESLAQCGKDIGSQCGEQVIKKLKDNDTRISTGCCFKLIQTGYPCHTKLTLYVLQNTPELKNANSTDLIAKSDKIFHSCDLDTKSASTKFLAKCTENLGIDCGEQVYSKLIYGKIITKNCCEKLVKNGPSCHATMVKALLRSPEMRYANATQLLLENLKIFGYCRHV